MELLLRGRYVVRGKARSMELLLRARYETLGQKPRSRSYVLRGSTQSISLVTSGGRW